MAKVTTKLSILSDGTTYGATCPICDAPILMTWEGSERNAGFPAATAKCPHYRRAWIVGADGRRRAEFEVAPAPATPAV